LDPETTYAIQAYCHETNAVKQATKQTSSAPVTYYIVEGIKGDSGVKSITISDGSDSESTTSSSDSVSMEVEDGSKVTWSYTFKSGYQFDYLETSEGNTSTKATSQYTYSSVRGDLGVTIYSKPATVTATAEVATEGVKIKVSGTDADGDEVYAIAEYGKSASIKVQIGSKVT
jgi:hypothetical protein